MDKTAQFVFVTVIIRVRVSVLLE